VGARGHRRVPTEEWGGDREMKVKVAEKQDTVRTTTPYVAG
jgi:hypothetical protein